MIFEVTISDGRMGQWQEYYDVDRVVDQRTAELQGRKTVDNFNKTRRPHEPRRVFVRASLLCDAPPQPFGLNNQKRKRR